jgi:hypothetical protein
LTKPEVAFLARAVVGQHEHRVDVGGIIPIAIRHATRVANGGSSLQILLKNGRLGRLPRPGPTG